VVALLLGAATARLMDLTSPSDIFTHQMRGPVVALHFVVALAVALLVGAIVRRVLPGLLVAIVVTTALFITTAIALQPWVSDQATLLPFAERFSQPIIAVLEHDFAIVTADGTFVEAEPACGTQAECMEAIATMTPVMRVVPGNAYLPLLAIESVLAAAVVIVCMAGTAAIIARWGPR
jgi:hypothetical protein